MSDEQQQLLGLQVQDGEQPGKKARGGAREGAGRKPKALVRASRVIRVPDEYAKLVQALIQHLDQTEYISRHYNPATSSQYVHRSLTGKVQFISFTTSGSKLEGTEAVVLEATPRQPRKKT